VCDAVIAPEDEILSQMSIRLNVIIVLAHMEQHHDSSSFIILGWTAAQDFCLSFLPATFLLHEPPSKSDIFK